LNPTSATRNCDRGSASSDSAPANPRPCSRPNAKTSATRWRRSPDAVRFSTATYAIDNAMAGSTIAGGSDTTPYMLRPNVIECATVKALNWTSTVRSRGLRRNTPSTKST
jgi:hypothetical protein